ncbi:MAG: 5'-methylthioadenosine/adenosylhomocysteine nucleosidase [Odoribacteraceae bacterium]|jgi:adenosylhomocysteine nucleosidase|nr:5'-methylthioadenosine/adenosylhomocysteine nucleosidase [Odoribacteraceae bacterium]
MKRVGIIVAMRAEYELARAVLERRVEHLERGTLLVEGYAEGAEVVLAQCGIGKVCSTIGAVEMIRRYNPDLIINAGVAGGIDPSLEVMDIVVGDEVVYHDVWCGGANQLGQVDGLPARFPADRELYRAALSIVPERGRVHGGLVCSGDRFIDSREELERIKKHFPEGLAVDMESGSLAQTCHLYGVPFLSYRMISDTPGVEDHARQYQGFWEEVPQRSFEMLRELIRHAAKENTRTR